MCLPPERLSPAGSSSRSSTPSSDLRGRLSPQLAEALAAVEDATDDLLPDLSEQCARAVAPAGEEDVFLELRWHEEDSGPVLPSSPFKDLPSATPQLDHVVLALFATQDVFLQDDAATAPEEAIPSAFDAICGSLAAAGSPPGLCARAHALAKLYDNMQAAPPDDKMQAALLDQLSLLFLDATERAVEAPAPAPAPADPPLEARLRHDGWCREFTRWLCAVPREQRRRFVAAIDGSQAVERAAAAEQAARTRRGDASGQPKGALPRLQQALWSALREELARLEVLLLSRPAEATSMLSFAAHQAASWRQRGVALPPYVAPRLLYEHACRRLWRAERAAAWPRARLSVHALLFHELLLASGALLVRACAEGLPAHSAARQLWEREAEEREAAALARRAPPYRGSEHDLKSA